jgi:hypothetical protein
MKRRLGWARRGELQMRMLVITVAGVQLERGIRRVSFRRAVIVPVLALLVQRVVNQGRPR